MKGLRVAIADEHEIFRRGAAACFADEPRIEIVAETGDRLPTDLLIDVGVASAAAARLSGSAAPLVVFHGDHDRPDGIDHARLLAWLPRRNLTPDQLIGAVLAAGAGLRTDIGAAPRRPKLKDRNRRVLSMLAAGADTREISTELGFSERTIKAAIAETTRRLGARNRAHAVAEAVRLNLI